MDDSHGRIDLFVEPVREYRPEYYDRSFHAETKANFDVETAMVVSGALDPCVGVVLLKILGRTSCA